MKTITITNRKGGTGKTTTCFALGSGLQQRGNKVLFVDLDSQANLTYDLDGDSQSSKNVLTLLMKAADIDSVIQHTPTGYDLIAGSPVLSGAEAMITDTGKEYKLREALEPIMNRYDYCVIDTPPQLGLLVVQALTASDFVVVPSESEVHSLQGLGLLYKTVQDVKKYCNSSLEVLGILLTRYNKRTIISKHMTNNIENMAEQMGTSLFDKPIRECVAIKESEALQTNIFEYAPASNGAEDFSLFVDDVLQRIEQ